jgi:hypothetical protein
MKRVKKTLTLPEELIGWAENTIKEGKYPGIRSLSGFMELLLLEEKKRSSRKS